MNNQDLIGILQGVTNAKRIYRDEAAEAILRNIDLIPKLLDKVYDIEDPLHIKAAWVLELVCLENINLLNPYISEFIRGISTLTHESALRPVSKVCRNWSSYYFKNKPAECIISKLEKEQIISCNFDWLIEDHKVATQVFAMDTLYLWGREDKWVHSELKSVLEKNTGTGTSGYKAHARKLLKNL